MPLHLLGKKSWNVYNPANIERVKRDEAEAANKELAASLAADEAEAVARLNALRSQSGSEPIPPPQAEPRIIEEDDIIRILDEPRPKKRRHEDTKEEEVSLVDERGNISLFQAPKPDPRQNKNAEAEAARNKQKQQFEDQYQMRLTAAGGPDASAVEKPWYTSQQDELAAPNKKPRFNNRETENSRRPPKRPFTDLNDPMALINAGVAQLRRATEARKEWKNDRSKDFEKEDRHRHKSRHERRPEERRSSGSHRISKHRDHRRRSRSRSRSRSRDRRRRHRSRERR